MPSRVLLLLLLVPLPLASANDLYVDVGNPNCPGDGSIADPYCSIQAAIQAAADGDRILVAPGTYQENIDALGKAIRIQSLAGRESTFLDGQQTGPVVTFQSGEGPGTVLEGFTIENGVAQLGGGIACLSASPTIRTNRLRLNTSRGDGGGIAVRFGSPLIEGNQIYSNFATRGAGLFLYESASLVRGNRIENNGASEEGGGLYLEGVAAAAQCSAAVATVQRNLITQNSARFGGGIAAGPASCPEIRSNTIRRNFVSDWPTGSSRGGGVLLMAGNPRALLTGNILDANQARPTHLDIWTYGGGLHANQVSDATIVHNTFFENFAYGPSGQVGNAAYFADSQGTFDGNIVWGSGAGSIAWTGVLPAVQYCDIEGGFPGTGNLSADPAFVDAPGKNFRLQCSSPCVEAGNPVPPLAIPELDRFREDLRVIGRIDIGADELGLTWTFNGPADVGGPPVDYTATASPGHPVPSLAEVYLSLGDGSLGGGRPVPGSLGRRLGLELDALLSFWLSLPTPVRQVTGLSGCSGSTTAALSIPASAPVGVTVHYAGVAWDLAGGAVTSVSTTRSFATQ